MLFIGSEEKSNNNESDDILEFLCFNTLLIAKSLGIVSPHNEKRKEALSFCHIEFLKKSGNGVKNAKLTKGLHQIYH